MRFVAFTARASVKGESFINKKQVIYALWHGKQLMSIALHRDTGLCAMASMSRDGNYIAKALSYLGFSDSVRGSSKKGGASAIRQFVRMAKETKRSMAITPDGPLGPIYKAKRGIIILAKLTNVPIIPITCECSCKIRFNSWDKFEIPLPFTKVQAVYGDPITVKHNDNDILKADELEKALNRVNEEAHNILHSGKNKLL